MKLNISLSTPFLVPATNFGLDETDYNVSLLKRLKKNPVLVRSVKVGKTKSFDLYRTGDANDGSLFIEHNQQLGWYVKFHTYKYKFLPVKAVTQTLIWKSADLPVGNDFSKYMFFKIVLELTGAVLSDYDHTDYGRDFWKRRLRESLAKGLHVAQVNFGTRSYEEITDDDHLEDLISLSWLSNLSKKDSSRQIRFIIWK